jgi:hypothetical protein
MNFAIKRINMLYKDRKEELDKFIGLAYYQGKKDIVFRFIIEYSRAEGILVP